MKIDFVVSSQHSVVSIFKKTLLTLFFILLTTDYCLLTTAFSADKSWNSEGDGSNWFDDANWLPAGKPAASDDAKVDMTGALVDVSQTFDAQSITIGGKRASTLNVSNFVNASIIPADSASDAMAARRGGKVVLKGSAGKITLKGGYKDSEEVIPEEPSFMLYVK